MGLSIAVGKDDGDLVTSAAVRGLPLSARTQVRPALHYVPLLQTLHQQHRLAQLTRCKQHPPSSSSLLHSSLLPSYLLPLSAPCWVRLVVVAVHVRKIALQVNQAAQLFGSLCTSSAMQKLSVIASILAFFVANSFC